MGPINSIVTTEIRSVLGKLPEVETFRLLEPHRTLKYLHVYDNNNPVEPGYYASFTAIESIGGELDPDINIDVSVLKQEFINKTPGY